MYPHGSVTKRDIAAAHKVSLRTVDIWVHDKVIPYMKLGRLVRFDPEAVAKALSRFTVKPVK
jgi:excisionase family DNA binding protein